MEASQKAKELNLPRDVKVNKKSVYIGTLVKEKVRENVGPPCNRKTIWLPGI